MSAEGGGGAAEGSVAAGWARFLALGGLAGIIGFTAWSYAEGGLVAVLLRGDLSAADKLDALHAFFTSMGAAAPAVYVALVTVEVVVAPIPGTVLYAPGGVIFGGFWGGTLSLLGNVLGAALAFAIMRALGRSAAERFIEAEHLGRYERRLAESGTLLVFLLRVNPLTSSDLVSYAAGLTAMPMRKLVAGTALGMAPLCYAQAYLAEGLLEAFPRLIYPLLVVGLGYAVLFMFVFQRTMSRGGSGR